MRGPRAGPEGRKMERDQEGAMNKPLMDNTVSPYRTFVVLLFLVAAASFVVTSPALAAPTIQWSQAGVTSSVTQGRSEERRVGKECGGWWGREQRLGGV